MAQAIIRGLVNAGHAPEYISVADPSQEQRDANTAINAAIRVTMDNAELAATSDILVLAVKPQIMAKVAEQLGTLPRPADQVVISVAAGITLESLCS